MAQTRRRRENDTFSDMAEVLPIQENAKDLDKASILRVAINYLKLRDLVGEKEGEENAGDETDEAGAPEECGVSVKKEEVDSETDGELAKTPEENKSTQLPNFAKDVLQALDGFMLVISSDGRILYTSESISTYLGLRQVDVIGISISDIVHPQDISELATIFKTQGKDSEHVFDRSDPLKRNFVVRMRCAFTPSVRSIARCSNFKPIYCSASLKFGRTEQTRGKFQGLVTLCKLASVSRIKEMCVGAFFKTKHSLDLGYTGIDTR
jgi:PAS domain-containing protein